jgi:hypothetical protein
MAIPSGSGTEVFKNVAGDITNTTINILAGADAGHIYIIKTLVVCNIDSTDAKIALKIHTGSSDYNILIDQLIGTDSTFVWNDPLVLTGTHILKLTEGNNKTCHYNLVYIDQDWGT